MDGFLVLFKKYITWLGLFYGVLFAIYIFGSILDRIIPLGMVIGNFMIFLLFFLSIPAGVVELIVTWTGTDSTYIIRLADMNPYMACIVICVFNVIVYMILVIVLSCLVFIWKQFTKYIKA